jgi:hypothetical protein
MPNHVRGNGEFKAKRKRREIVVRRYLLFIFANRRLKVAVLLPEKKHLVTRCRTLLFSQAAVCLFLLLQTTPAQYRFDSFTTDNGLPQNGVRRIAQTPDGYLWFTTFDELVRF